jgi:hypothetical protein
MTVTAAHFRTIRIQHNPQVRADPGRLGATIEGRSRKHDWLAFRKLETGECRPPIVSG